jgi:dihydrofolate reductase
VHVNGGADIARQYLQAGTVQELRLHVVPIVLGAGTRLFDDKTPPKLHLRPVKAASTPLATHLTYEVSAAG